MACSVSLVLSSCCQSMTWAISLEARAGRRISFAGAFLETK